MIWANGLNPGGKDTFRIKIWCEVYYGIGIVVYDNGPDQAIASGNIKVHSK
jgi:hypothetical protein